MIALVLAAVLAVPSPPSPMLVDEGTAVNIARAAASSTLSAYGIVRSSSLCQQWRQSVNTGGVVTWVQVRTSFPGGLTDSQQRRGVRQALDARCW